MKTFAVVRPYPDDIRRLVFQRLISMGWDTRDELRVDPGVSNEVAVAWIKENFDSFHLLLCPFHLHRDSEGNRLDGFGVLENLPESWDRPILMPVTSYSFSASFERRLDEFAQARPRLMTSRFKALPLSVFHEEMNRDLHAWLSEVSPRV